MRTCRISRNSISYCHTALPSRTHLSLRKNSTQKVISFLSSSPRSTLSEVKYSLGQKLRHIHGPCSRELCLLPRNKKSIGRLIKLFSIVSGLQSVFRDVMLGTLVYQNNKTGVRVVYQPWCTKPILWDLYSFPISSHSCFSATWVTLFIIQHIDTLPKYGHNTLDVRRSDMTYIQRWM